jgi:hypothetical protein
MEVSAEGYDDALIQALNDTDARALWEAAKVYAKGYVSRLVRGQIYRTAYCEGCQSIELEMQPDARIVQTGQAHLLGHMTKGDAPATLLRTALGRYIGRGQTGQAPLIEAINSSWAEVQPAWRRARTQKEIIAKTELLILEGEHLSMRRPHP